MDQRAIDADTQTSAHSYDAALKAAAAGIIAVDAIISEQASTTFAAICPPGHYATKYQAMGSCLFNIVVIAVRYAQTKEFEKVLIIDLDVHHANGTQDIFYDDETVFYFSTHQYPACPGSSSVQETGSGDGEGYTHDFPLAPGSGDELLLPIYEEALPKVVRAFQSDIILVSAG